MFHKITNSFYTKIIFLCTVLVITITASLLYISHQFIKQQEIDRYLSSYNIALTNQSTKLSAKLTTFSEFFLPLISDPDAYDVLCELYRSPNGNISNESNEILLDALYKLCNSDTYCCGLLLLTRSGRLYQYDTRYATLIPLEFKTTTFRFTPYTLQLLSDSQISELSNDLERSANHVYGISGTIFQFDEEPTQNLGYLIALYSTEEFHTVLVNLGLENEASFYIFDTNYQVLYSSTNDYEGSQAYFLPRKQKQESSSHSEIETMRLEQPSYYVSSLYQDLFHYFVTYQLPSENIEMSRIQTMVLIIGLIISLTCILLYGFVLRFSRNRIRKIKQGMELVGQNNLDYRMTVPKTNDEFSSIIRYFNQMCDELQRNVEQTYLFEISQQKAELYAMQTSINPHFLYNTLEQIHVQIQQNQNANASKMLLLLSKMYRYQTKRNLFVSISEECSQMENLINLYSYRTGGCEYELLIESSLKKYGVPKNILQPLIENSFIHGFQPEQDNFMVTITISSITRSETMFLHFLIEDNGSSITPEKLTEIEKKLMDPVMSHTEHNGFALSNVNSRLVLTFGKDAALHPYIGKNGGFCISFTIPPMLPEELSARFHSTI